MRTLIFIVVALSCGCRTWTGADAARWRAYNEYRCGGDEISVIHRVDLSPATYDVNACGVEARYTCTRQKRSYPNNDEITCVPEWRDPRAAQGPITPVAAP